ncbi:phosphatidylinositol N-acetylglucosaminyltransferase subunit C [Bemisia tabaci]|uniref:phosphatidylinositol N-acetylglucosaminyltransferase subunit C n=1 Tax=Bemisia tabaci TaxID=7038 RepID=UPI003B27C747
MKCWKKNLYENKGYPDNYTDKTFLDELKKNLHVRSITFQEACLGAGLVIQEFCIIIFFILGFIYLYNEWIQPEALLSYLSLATCCSYILFFSRQYSILKVFRTLLVFLLFSYLLAPILKTLTETISTDTIYALTVFMMSVHLIFFDYGVPATIVSSSLSLNAAIFASICLASRLPSPFHTFVLITLAVECFVLCPILISKIGKSFLVIFILSVIAAFGLLTVSRTMTFLFILVILFINFICPLAFVRLQRYKDNIYGPWDEAVVR